MIKRDCCKIRIITVVKSERRKLRRTAELALKKWNVVTSYLQKKSHIKTCKLRASFENWELKMKFETHTNITYMYKHTMEVNAGGIIRPSKAYNHT